MNFAAISVNKDIDCKIYKEDDIPPDLEPTDWSSEENKINLDLKNISFNGEKNEAYATWTMVFVRPLIFLESLCFE